jgi:hypothetical protein
MVTRISFWQPAGTYDVPGKGQYPQEYAPHAFDQAVGKQVPVKGPDRQDLGLCTVVAAEVAEDGTGVMLTIEVPENCGLVFSPPAGAGSFSFREPDPDQVPHDPLDAKPPRITWKP